MSAFHEHLSCFIVFQVYKVCSDTFDIYDQHFGRGLAKDTIKEGMCDWNARAMNLGRFDL